MNVRLHPGTVWQADRRNALRILQAQQRRARTDGRWDHSDALMMAVIDVEDVLRSRAAYVIEEGHDMRFAQLALPGVAS